jgi:hypothetical protein
MPVENYTLKIVAAERDSTSASYYPYVLVNNVQVGRLDFSSINKATWNEFTFNINLDPTVSYLELKIQVNRYNITGYYIDNVKLFHENDSTTNLIFNPGMYVDNSKFTNGIWAKWNEQYEEWYFGVYIGLFNVTTFANDNLRDGDNYQLFLAHTGHIKQTLNITRNSIEQSDNPNTFEVDLSFSNPYSTEPVKSASYTFSTSNQSPLSTYVYTNYFEKYKLQFNARSRLNNTKTLTTDIYYSTTDAFDTSTSSSLIKLGSVTPTNTDTTVYSYDISLSPTTEYFAIRFENSNTNSPDVYDGNCFYNIQLIAYDPNTVLSTNTNLIADSDMKLGTGGLNNTEWYRLHNNYNESWYIYSIKTAIHEKNSTSINIGGDSTIDTSVNANTETVCIFGPTSYLIQELAINRTYDTVTDKITTTFTNKINNQITNSYVYNISSFISQFEYTYDPPSQINFITFGGSGTGNVLFTIDDSQSKIRLSASSNYISGTSLENLSDNTNNATITGNVEYTYKDGRYCYYIHDSINEFGFPIGSGSNYITLPSGLLTNLNKYTFSGFFNLNKYDGNLFGSNNGLYLSVLSFTKSLFLTSPIIGNIEDDTNELTLNTWYHISYTYDHAIQETKLYINGSLVKTNTRYQFNLVEPLFLGAYNPSGTISPDFGFYFDAINIYDKVLTPEQIAKMYPSTASSLTTTDLVPGNYEISAMKSGNDFYFPENYDMNTTFSIEFLTQAEFELSGVIASYDYKKDITFDTSGGSGTGDVDYTLYNYDLNYYFGIVNNPFTDDISAGNYRVTALKNRDTYYEATSASVDFSINPINQASLIITDIQPLYNYKHDIYFNVEAESTGKTTAVVEESGVYTEVTSPFNIYDRNATNYITASNEGDINYNETTSSNSVAINLTNSDIKVPSENYILKIVAAETPYNSNPSYYPIVIVNDIQVGRLDFSSIGTGIWKEFTFNTSIDVLISSLEIKIQVIRQTITGYYIDNVQLFHESDNTTNLIFNPGMYLNSTLLSNSQYGAWYVSSNIQQVTGGTESFNKNGTTADNNHVFINNYGFIKHSLQIDRTLTPQIANPNTFDVNLTFSNSNVVDQTNTINYTFDISNQEQPLSIIPSTLLEKYKLEFNCRPRLDSANTTDIYYSTSNAYNSDEFNINGIESSSTLKNRISTSSKFIKLGTITPTNEDDTLHSFIFSLPPIFDLLTVHFINTNSNSGMANFFYNIQLFAINPYTDIDTGINLISDPNVQLGTGTNGLDDDSWYNLTNGYNDSWYTNNIAHEKNSITEDINANTETLIIQGSGYLIQELSVTRTFNNSTNEITTSFKNRPTNQVTGSYTYTVPVFYYSPSPQNIYVLSSGGSGYGDLSFTGDLTVDSDRLLPTIINANDYTINATKLGDTYYNDSATTFTLTINPGDQTEFELSGVITSYDYKDDITFDTSGGSSTGDVSFILEHETFGIISIDNNKLTENISGGNYRVIATKFGDSNYKDISAHLDFTIDPIDQITPLAFVGLNSYYLYTDSISWSTSGGDGLGVITYDISGLTNTTQETFTDPNIDPTTYSVGDYSFKATKAATINYNESQVFQTVSITKAPQSSFQTDYGFIENYRVKVRARSADSSNLATFNVFVNTSNTSATPGNRTNDQEIINEIDIPAIFSYFSADFSVYPDVSNLYVGVTNTSSTTKLYVDSIELFFINPDGSLSDNLLEKSNMEMGKETFYNYGTDNYWFVQRIDPTISTYNVETESNISDDGYAIHMLNAHLIQGLVIERNNTSPFTKEVQYRNYQQNTSHKSLSYELYYGSNLYFFNTGGSINSLVTYDDTSIVNNTWTTPNVGSYTIIATKAGDSNYFDISNSISFQITKSPQAIFQVDYGIVENYRVKVRARSKELSSANIKVFVNTSNTSTISNRTNDQEVINEAGLSSSYNDFSADFSVQPGVNYLYVSVKNGSNSTLIVDSIELFYINHDGTPSNNLLVNSNMNMGKDIFYNFSNDGYWFVQGSGGSVKYYEYHSDSFSFSNLTILANSTDKKVISIGENYTITQGLVIERNNTDIYTKEVQYRNYYQTTWHKSLSYELYYGSNLYFFNTGGSTTNTVTYDNASIVNNTWTTPDAGIYTIIASKAGDSNYFDISDNVSFTINKSNQDTLTLTGISSTYTYSNPINYSTTGGSNTGTSVNFDISGIDNDYKSTTSNTSINNLDTGNYSIFASKDGDVNYYDISSTTVNFVIIPANQATLTISNLNSTYPYQTDITFTTSGGTGGGAISFDVRNESNVTIPLYNNNTIQTDISGGTYTVIATKGSSRNYNEISSQQYSFTVTKIDQTLFRFADSLVAIYEYENNIIFSVQGGNTAGTVSYDISGINNSVYRSNVGNSIYTLDGGEYTAIATKDGDINYKDVSATFDFTINPTDQTPLGFDGLNSYYLYTDSISWSISGGDGLGVITYDISGLTNTTQETFTDPSIDPTTYSVGDYSFKATKAATINYNESQVIQTVSITKAPQSSFQTDYGIVENYRVKVRARSYDSSNLATFNVFVNISNTSNNNDRTNDQVIIDEADISTSYSDFSADFSIQPDINYIYIGLKNVSNRTLIIDSIELFFINPDGSLSDDLLYIYWNTIGDPANYLTDPDESYKINSDDNYISVMTDIFTFLQGLVIERNNTNTFTKELKYRDYNISDTWHKTLSYELYYGLSLYFFNTGGSTTNTVTYDEPSIVSNTWTTPDAGIYTIIASKAGDSNYFDISNSIDISINRAEQDPFVFVNLQDYYDYQTDISFNTTGGTGNGEVSYTISHNNYNTIVLEGNELTFDISVGTYTITALKQPPDNNYNSISAIDTFIINGIDQSELFIIGVNNNYDYTENIVFNTTGGDGNGDISFVLLHDTFGTITINGNTLSEDISAGHYTVKAFKFSDGNYNDTSATFDFSINPIDQADFELYNVDPSFNYRYDIVFDTSGGSGDGVVSYTVKHDTYGLFTVDGNTFTEDISVGHYTVTATKAASLNFIEKSATFDFSINPIDQADFELYNVDTSFNYRKDIVFDTSGGSGDGTVSYEINNDTYGLFTVDGNTFTEDISVGHYTVTATKAASLNFIEKSATFDFSINPIDQADFELYNVDTSYNYRENIVFDASGGSGDGVVSYKINNETYDLFNVDGNTLFEDISVGHYTVTATKAASLNFIEKSATFDFSINPIDQADFELYNVDTSYNHRYDIVFDTSGGSGDGGVSYTVKHDTYGEFTVDGDTFTEDISVGHYTVTATKASSLNFFDISATFDFSINVINQDLLEFFNVSPSYPYKTNISLDTSGGSGSGNVTFGVSHNEYGTIPLVNGNTIVEDICAGFYTITATKGASLNFYEENITSTITVTRIEQDPFFITNESSYVFVEGQSIDIDTNGGSIESDITVVINLVNDEENFDDITLFNPNGEPRIIIPDVGTYIVRATKAGDINYVDAITNSIITITQATQSNLLFYNQPSYVYDPTQTIPLDVSGGSGNGAITMNVLYNGGELTDVTELVAPVVGDYWIEITKAESKNYFSITQEFPITILKAEQQPLVNETLVSSIVYYPELVIDLSASGGTTDNPITFTINGEPGTQLNSANNTNYIGNYSIVATKEGNENYNGVTLNFTISITKLLQSPIEITVPSVNIYELQNSSIEAKIKGGSTDNDFIISFDSNAMTVNNTGTIDDEGNHIYDIFYTRPGTVSMTVLKKGNEDYMDVSATVQFDIVKNMHHIKNNLHIRPRKAFNDPYIDEQDIISVYTVDELVDNMITNVFNPDPNLKNRFNTRELRSMNVNACVVYGTRRFTAADLKAGGYKITFCTR